MNGVEYYVIRLEPISREDGPVEGLKLRLQASRRSGADRQDLEVCGSEDSVARLFNAMQDQVKRLQPLTLNDLRASCAALKLELL